MELIKLINTLNNILQPHFYLVDGIYSNIPITNFENLIGQSRLFWRFKSRQNTKFINANEQNQLLDTVKQLNLGKAELCTLFGLGKYLIFDLQ